MSATSDLIPILVDCSTQGANADLLGRFGVRGFPTVLLLDPDGAQVGSLGNRAPAAVVATLKAHTARYPSSDPAPGAASGSTPSAGVDPVITSADGRIRVSVATLDDGLERARATGRLLAVIYADPEKDERKRQADRVLEALSTRGMDSLAEQFTWIFRPSCDAQKAATPEADAYQAGPTAPTVVLFDPWAEVPAGETRAALGRCADLKVIRNALQSARREAARAHHPPPRR